VITCTLSISLQLAIISGAYNCLDAVFMLSVEANRVWKLDLSLSLSLSLSIHLAIATPIKNSPQILKAHSKHVKWITSYYF